MEQQKIMNGIIYCPSVIITIEKYVGHFLVLVILNKIIQNVSPQRRLFSKLHLILLLKAFETQTIINITWEYAHQKKIYSLNLIKTSAGYGGRPGVKC